MEKNAHSDHVGSWNPLTSSVLSLSAAAAIIGPFVYVVVTLFHPPGADANNHSVVFREYAASDTWIAIHLIQLAAMVAGLIGIAGLAASMLRLQVNGRAPALLAMALAIASIPLAALLQAVDGISQKRAVDAWVAAGGALDSPSFAAANAMRWLEQGFNSVLYLTVGLSVILVGAAMVRGTGYPSWLGWLGGAIGIAVLINAVLVAETGFSPSAQMWILARNPILWVWTVVAGVLMWRRRRLLDATSVRDSDRAPIERRNSVA